MSETRQTYSEETKAAVLAALLTGQAVNEVAKAYKVPPATVRSWKSRQVQGGVANLATQKRDRIGELLVSYLESSISTLQIQVELFADETWLFKQPASEAAVLHGVIADKAIRLLEALSNDPDEDETEDDEESGA